MMLTNAPSRPGLLRAALCMIFLLQHVPLSTGHLRHGHGHHHHHQDEHDHSDYNNHHHHRRTSSLESDFSPHHADIFDSCLVACYDDIVDRYGVEFAEQLKADGFSYEECPTENSDAHHTNSTDGQEQQQQQRALNRLLGATNQLHRIWAIPSYRGSNGRLHIPYAIKTTDWFTNNTLSTIQKAMSHIELSTGVIQFVPRANQVEYIYFNHETHYEKVCAANLGRQTGRQTNVYLGWCNSERHLGNIVHELLHALGFWHEHSRPDRDEHVFINFNNLQSSARNNFAKATMVNSLGSPYDFNSIMHYPPIAFSTNNQPTIIPQQPLEKWQTMGQRAQLSEHDVEQLRLLYQCASGPRDGGVAMSDLCSVDCPCWEHALGECSSDDECMDDLICGNVTPGTLSTTVEYVDLLPVYTATGGQFSCDDYCHPNCCGYANSIVRCRETCDSAPPVRVLEEVPERMCILSDGGSVSTVGTTTVAATTSAQTTTTTASTTAAATTTTATTTTASTTAAATTTTATTTTASTTAVATTTTTTTTSSTPLTPPWYYDKSIDKCVQFCFGPAPCGGFGRHDAKLHPTVQACCNDSLSYMPFEACHPIPQPTSSTMESNSPSSFPSQSTLPSNAPVVTDSPTYFPTIGPTTAPSRSPTMQPTKLPSQSPSKQPSNSPVMTTTTTTAATTTTAVEISSLSGEWYIDWGINKCVRDCIGKRPCRSRRKSSWQKGYATVQSCCSTMSHVRLKKCSYDENSISQNSGNISPPNAMWYPATTTCQNDGNAPAWQLSEYSSQSTCCSSHFNEDHNNCMGITPAPSHKWYISWAMGKCVKDCDENEGGSCGGLVPASWVTMHDSADACCDEHMSSSTIVQCKYN